MILKASQRSGAKQLGLHLMKTEENEHVEEPGLALRPHRGHIRPAFFRDPEVSRALRSVDRFGAWRGTQSDRWLITIVMSAE